MTHAASLYPRRSSWVDTIPTRRPRTAPTIAAVGLRCGAPRSTSLVPDMHAVGTSVGVVDLSEYQSSDTRRSNRYILSWHLLAVAVPD